MIPTAISNNFRTSESRKNEELENVSTALPASWRSIFTPDTQTGKSLENKVFLYPDHICCFLVVMPKSSCCVISCVFMGGRWSSAPTVFWSAIWMENRIPAYLMIYVKTCQSFSMPQRGCFPTEICISDLVLSSCLYTRPCLVATSLHGTKITLTGRAS